MAHDGQSRGDSTKLLNPTLSSNRGNPMLKPKSMMKKLKSSGDKKGYDTSDVTHPTMPKKSMSGVKRTNPIISKGSK